MGEQEHHAAVDPEDTSLVNVSTSRLGLLKALDGTRRTASELARETDQSKSTVHGQLTDLVEEGLVQRHEDEDRLWVYYSLTEQAQSMIRRDKVHLVVDLSTLATFIASGIVGLYRFLNPPQAPTQDGPGIAGGPSPEPAPGTDWLLIAYIALTALTLAGFLASRYLAHQDPQR